MQNCRASVLVFMLYSFAFFSPASAFTSTIVKLNEDATLLCNQNCSGLLTWTMFSKPDDVLARCDKRSCWSQEGFQLSHDQYLKGNLSLTITSADFSKRDWYTCECEGNDICHVSLHVEPFNLSIHIESGASLTLDLPISEPVELIFNRTDNVTTNSVSLFKVDERQIECNPEYKRRVSLSLQLKEVKHSDSGVYILGDGKNKEIYSLYTVMIKGPTEAPEEDGSSTTGAQPNWKIYLIIVAVVPTVLLVIAVVVIIVLLRKNKQLQIWKPKRANMEAQQNDLQSSVMETDDGQVSTEQTNPQHGKDHKSADAQPFLKKTEDPSINEDRESKHCLGSLETDSSEQPQNGLKQSWLSLQFNVQNPVPGETQIRIGLNQNGRNKT